MSWTDAVCFLTVLVKLLTLWVQLRKHTHMKRCMGVVLLLLWIWSLTLKVELVMMLELKSSLV